MKVPNGGVKFPSHVSHLLGGILGPERVSFFFYQQLELL